MNELFLLVKSDLGRNSQLLSVFACLNIAIKQKKKNLKKKPCTKTSWSDKCKIINL